MKPVVLLVGRLPNVIANVAKQLEHLPVEWLGAHNGVSCGIGPIYTLRIQRAT